MYALMESTPYEGEWPIVYFGTEDEANEALRFIYAHDETTHKYLPREEWDWGYFVKEIRTKTLEEFRAPYKHFEEVYERLFPEETTLGGDDCYIGRGLWSGDKPNPNTDLNGFESKPISDGYWGLPTD